MAGRRSVLRVRRRRPSTRRLDLGERPRLERRLRQAPAGVQSASGDLVSYRAERARRDAQLVHAEPDEQARSMRGPRPPRRRPRRGRPRAAQPGDPIDETQDGRLERRRELGEGRVRPIGGERVLDEVVRPDAEEVGDLGQAVGDQRRGLAPRS